MQRQVWNANPHVTEQDMLKAVERQWKRLSRPERQRYVDAAAATGWSPVRTAAGTGARAGPVIAQVVEPVPAAGAQQARPAQAAAPPKVHQLQAAQAPGSVEQVQMALKREQQHYQLLQYQLQQMHLQQQQQLLYQRHQMQVLQMQQTQQAQMVPDNAQLSPNRLGALIKAEGQARSVTPPTQDAALLVAEAAMAAPTVDTKRKQAEHAAAQAGAQGGPKRHAGAARRGGGSVRL